MFKFLWLDTETTGLDPEINDPIQIAGIIVANGKEEKFKYNVQPINTDPEGLESASKIHGISKKEMMSFPRPDGVYNKIVGKLGKYVNKYDKTDKFVLSGQNVQFDCDMMKYWFEKLGDPYWFSWVGYSQFDLKNLAIMYEMKIKSKMPGHKLTEICSHLGVELSNAHDAMADIVATREACQIIWAKITQ